MLPVIPQQVNNLIQNSQGQISTFPFPLNLAGFLTKEQRQKIWRWMLQTYVWPQVMERRPFEAQWDKLLMMAKASWKYSDSDIDENSRLNRARQSRILDSTGKPTELGDDESSLVNKIKIADTVIFDAVDRLTNLAHFIMFKERTPVRFEIPQDTIQPYENDVYSPMSDLVRSINAWLRFNQQNSDVYRKSWSTSRHHYTYGVSFVSSEYMQKIESIPRRQPDGSFKPQLELTDIGITFEPISIRKLWLNWRLPVYKMDYQPCPFHFEEMPRFALNANLYDAKTNPMGFVNTDITDKGDWLFTGAETASLQEAYKISFPHGVSFTNLLDPQYSVELLWTFYPMLPIELAQVPQTDQNPTGIEVHIVDKPDPQNPNQRVPVPMKRYIMQTFGTNLVDGSQEILRLQENFYPHNGIPLYGSAHMPTLDDGAYTSAIGTILEGHYTQICKALLQFLENKEWINDPPVTIMHTSPALTKQINKKGVRIPVMSQNDIQRREPFDATGTTVAFIEYVREQAKTSSKATEAILGKAMGSRTSATEATNVFQTAMSGITTDVNMFTNDIHGGYASRVWEYTGRWVDPDVLAMVTGSYGFAVRPEHLQIRMGIVWDTGSQFIESITRQQNIQYMLGAFPPGTTEVNRAYLAEELLTEWRFKNVRQIINDGGRDEQIQLATEEAIRTYMGEMVFVDPDADHNVAIKVLKSFLMHRQSYWNTNPATVIYGPKLAELIGIHQKWLQLQMMQMQLMQQQMMISGQTDILHPMQTDETGAAPTASPGTMARTPGQQRQQQGR